MNVIINDIEKSQWEQYARNFADYSIYQTLDYQRARVQKGRQCISVMIIKDDASKVVCMGQVRIMHIRALNLRIGYVQRGPLVRNKEDKLTCTVEALREMKKAYLGKKVDVLRLVPNAWNNETGKEFSRMLECAGFRHNKLVKPYRTIFVPLQCSGEELRKNLHQSWRRMLRKSAAENIQIEETTSIPLFEKVCGLYKDMLKRKGIDGVDAEDFMEAQKTLSPETKMDCVVASLDGELATIHVTSNLGDTAVLLLVVNTLKGLECRSSYLSWWQAILTSNKKKMKRYDVGGVDVKKSPNIARFKAGIGGEECCYIGAFDVCSGPFVRMLWYAINRAYKIFVKS